MVWTKTGDGSIVDESGKVIFFSTQRFIKDICLGDCCFICGVDPSESPFNNEHVLPEWLLRRYDLFARKIMLPNGRTTRYDRHTVPCCVKCNSLMGREIEERISQVIDGNSDSIQNFVANGGGIQLFVWLGLIYLKLHLKDKNFRKGMDQRISSGTIADDYDWQRLHHIHTVVRCFYIPSKIEASVIGSMLILPCRQEGSPDQFDFSELHFAQTMMMRLGDTAVFVVFNDSNGALSFFSANMLHKITGPVNELQAREIMTELAILNLHLKEPPVFSSEIDTISETHTIKVSLTDRLELEPLDYKIRGELLWNAFQHAWPQLRFAGSTREEVKKVVLTGKMTVLFDDKGNFVDRPDDP